MIIIKMMKKSLILLAMLFIGTGFLVAKNQIAVLETTAGKIEIELSESRGNYGSKTNVGLELNSQSLAAKDMKVEGTYSNDVKVFE